MVRTGRRSFFEQLGAAAIGAVPAAFMAREFERSSRIAGLKDNVTMLSSDISSLQGQINRLDYEKQEVSQGIEQATSQLEALSTAAPPRPVDSDIKVAAYHITGWGTGKGFKSMDWSLGAPYTPLLGRYTSDDPRVADWHIKWALEHGISAFLYFYSRPDFGWERCLEQGVMKSRFFDSIDFALLHCNDNFWPGNPFGMDPVQMDEASKVTLDYASMHLFPRRNYLSFEGRPIVILFRYWDFAYRFGIEKALFWARNVRQSAEDRGYDVYLMGDFVGWTWQHDDSANRLVSRELDALTAYNLGQPSGIPSKLDEKGNWTLVCPYEKMVEAYLREYEYWSSFAKNMGKGFVPTVPPGFDNSLMYEMGVDNWMMRLLDPTVQRFKVMCESAKRYAEENLNLVSVEAWNEFQEGSVVEPSMEFGFSFLDAIRDTYARMPTGGWPEEAIPGLVY